MARRRKLKEHLRSKNCCFCGGNEPATTVDHVPPIVFFKNKLRPKGLEFPACDRCNRDSSLRDTVVALFCHISADAVRHSSLTSNQVNKLLQAVKNNCPEVLEYIGPATQDYQLSIGDEKYDLVRVALNKAVFQDWLNPWAAKVGCALWYEHTGKYLTHEMRILVRWISNDKLLIDGMPQSLIDMHGNLSAMKQGRESFGDQFAYRYMLNVEAALGSFVLLLQNSALALVSILPVSEMGKLRSEVRAGETFYISQSRGISATIAAPIVWTREDR